MTSLILFALFVAVSQNALESLCVPLEVPKYYEFRSKERLAKAAEMHRYMNESVDPCSDFYAFSCGNWPSVYPATDYTSKDSIVADAFQLKIKQLLQSPANPDDNEIDKKVKAFYESCTNEYKAFSIEDYREKLIEIMDEFGGMPAVKGDDWNEDNFDWLETVAKISHKYSEDIILALAIDPDLKMLKNKTAVYIESPEFPLETRSMYMDEENADTRQAYKEGVASVLWEHLNLSEELAEQVAEEIVEFEVLLAAGLDDNNLGIELEELTELTTATAMTQKYGPMLNIEKLISIVIPEAANEPIYEFHESYQRNLVEVLETMPKHIIANYIMYSLLDEFALDLNENVTVVDFCVERTRAHFGKHLDKMVYRHYNAEASERDFNTVWQEVKQSFNEVLHSNKLSWMAPATRQQVIEKLNAMQMEINTHRKYNSVEELGDLKIQVDDYFGNVKNTMEQAARRYLARLHKEPIIDEVETSSVYSPTENMVQVLVAQLEPFFFGNSPHALKFGAIGSLLGNVLMYGFIDDGMKFDKDGNSVDWSDDGSVAAFERLTQCFADQFSQDSYGDFELNPNLPQSANMAEYAGMRLAHAAYLRWLPRAEKPYLETLLTMKYTNKQLFFISYAQNNCEDIHPSQMAYITSRDYMPSMFRINAALSNYEDFAKEFGCSAETPMNRGHQRCGFY